jgi:hypothetical protein
MKDYLEECQDIIDLENEGWLTEGEATRQIGTLIAFRGEYQLSESLRIAD